MFFVASLVGCGQMPAEVKFAGDEKVTVFTKDQVPVQAATVNDKDGKALDKQPDLKWSVSDESVAKLEGGKLTPQKSGTTMVKACATDTVCKDYSFVVALPDKLAISGTDGVEWKVGTKTLLAAKVMSGDTEVPNQTVTWTSDNPAIATVDASGAVNALAAGTAKITAAADGLTADVPLTITAGEPAKTN